VIIHLSKYPNGELVLIFTNNINFIVDVGESRLISFGNSDQVRVTEKLLEIQAMIGD